MNLNWKAPSILLSYIVFSLNVFSQKNAIRVFGGIGVQNLVHYGLDFQHSEKFKTSISHGILYNNNLDQDADNRFKMRSYNLSNYYLFGKSKKFEGATKFYLKHSFNFWRRKETNNYTNFYIIPILRF